MNQCLDTILTQNLTGKEKQPLLLTRMESLVATIQYADCWDLGQRCLEDVVGYRPFPENVSQIQIIASLVKTKYRMKKYRDKIVDLSLLEDETRIFAYKVIEHMVAASYYRSVLGGFACLLTACLPRMCCFWLSATNLNLISFPHPFVTLAACLLCRSSCSGKLDGR